MGAVRMFLIAVAAMSAACAIADAGPSASKSQDGGKLSLGAINRVERNWNRGWRFRTEGDAKAAEEYAKPSFDDTRWRWVDAPHDYEFELPWNEKSKGSIGFKSLVKGWYRKRFTPEETWKGRKVLLEFEGLMAVGDVFLNGEKVASTEYGYLGCVADIGAKLKWGEENVIAVRCDAGKMGGSRWYAGGGIVRDVWLVVKSPVSVDRHGLYVKTLKGEGDAWTVDASVQLDGYQYAGRANRLDVILEVFDPEGRRIARGETLAPWSKKAHQTVALPPQTVAAPKLWDIDAPALYTAVATLRLNGEVVDRVKERFGFRTIEFGPDFGFRLNGRKVWLQGIANHADYGAVGCAAYDRAVRRQFATMKKFGFNAIRCSHNPYSVGMLRLADEMGILVVDELIDKWSDTSCWNGRVNFTDIWDELITEWIKRDRNHPSVIMWSLGNELQQREEIAGFATDDWAVTTYRIFDVMTKRWDATRPTTVAMFPTIKDSISRKDKGFDIADPEPPELSTVTEVASYNYMYANYASYKKHNPNLTIFQSEASVHDLQRPIVAMDKATTVGLCYWGAIAYWGESDGWPKKGWCYSFFDRTLQPYPTAYLIKSFFSDEPVVHIGTIKGKEVDGVVWNDIKVGRVNAAEDWNFEDGAKVLLYTYTNADEVELLVNGKSVGVKKNDRGNMKEANAIRWADVPYEAGAVTAVARMGGKEVARHTIETSGPAVRLVAEVEDPDGWKGDGLDLQYVRVTAVDAEGRRVRSARDSVKFAVSGAATLLAVDDGDPNTDLLFKNVDEKPLMDGSLLVILRAKPAVGAVTLTATAAHLPPLTVDLKTVK